MARPHLLSPQSLARRASHRPWTTVIIWVVVMVAAGGLISTMLGDALTTDIGLTNDPEAQQAADLIEERLRGPEKATEVVIVRSPDLTVDDAAFRNQVESLAQALRGMGGDVLNVATFYETGDAGLVSGNRRITLLPTTLDAGRFEATDLAAEVQAVAEAAELDGFETLTFGPGSLNEDLNRVAEEDLRSGESIGIMAALIILVVVFGAVVAALLPVLTAIAAIAVALGLVGLTGLLFDFSFFVTNMISMIGLAVGIDYSLFIVSRYREERAAGRDRHDAIEVAGATASRAVLFSGMTVVLALLGMLLIPNTIFRSLAGGAIFVVLAAVAASLTLLPAILGLLGDRIDRLRVRRRSSSGAEGGGFWDVITGNVMRRPVLSLVVGVSVMLVAAWSWTDMRTGFSGVSTIPTEFQSRQAFDVLTANFAGGLSSPVEVAVDGPATDPGVVAAVEQLSRAMAGDDFIGTPKVTVNPAGDLTLLSSPLLGDPASELAVDAIERVREDYVPAAFDGTGARVLVGGETAFNADFFAIADRYMPIVFAFVLGLSFMLLTVAFRSVVVPIKAIALNLLSVATAYGLVVLVSQKGVGADLLGIQQVEVIEAWLPLFLFSVLFGLSMDYHVFLLSRIREHYDLTGDNTEAVAHGVRTTARIITGAALIMVAVFGGFATGRLASFQQMGFGLGVAVLIDATLVRSVLVPASMKLLGERNWYLPRWLEWLPRLDVEGARASVGAPPAEAPPVPQTAGPRT